MDFAVSVDHKNLQIPLSYQVAKKKKLWNIKGDVKYKM